MQPNILDMYHGDNREKLPDFAALATFGFWGVIHKSSQGLKYTDPKFHDRIMAAHDAGFLVGAYHYMDASDAIGQAETFLEIAFKTLPTAAGNFLLAFDYEKSADGNHPALHQLQDAMAFVDKNVPGIMSMPYGSDLIRETLTPTRGGHTSQDMTSVVDFFRQHRLWLAEYGPHENIPYPWNDTDMGIIKPWLWQYKATGHLPGIIGDTDLNYYAGTREQLAAEWSAGPTPATALQSKQTLQGNRGYMGN